MNLSRRILAFALLLAASLPGPAEAQRTKRVFLGYYAAPSGMQIEKIPFRGLTHLCHAFLAVSEEGKIVKNDLVPNKQLTDLAHQRGVKVLLSIGGGKTALGLEKIASHDQAIAGFTRDVARIVSENNYDGVDLDWEFPRDRQTRSAYTKVVTAIRQQLDAAAKSSGRRVPYRLTAVVPPSGDLGKWIDVGAVQRRLDWLNIAAYDMSGPWERTAAHHAPLHSSADDPEKAWRSVSSAVAYWNKDRGVDVSRLVVGVPMYGRAMPASEVYQEFDPKRKEEHRAMPYNELRELVGKGWPAMWDSKSKAPWLKPPAEQNKKQPLLVCFEDHNSVKEKAQWAKEQNCRGLYFWAIHQDRMPDGAHWLLLAANRAWPTP